ncbi:MAG: hypothetical protein FWB93_00710 [Oscillospiraceae bacterium]|nr:hypothetical protein [Oscillospiraceae bacterium]
MKLKIYTAEEKAHRKSLLLRCLFVLFVLPLANTFLVFIPSIVLSFNAASHGWGGLGVVADLLNLLSSIISSALPIVAFAIFGLSYFKYSDTTKVRGIFKPFFYLPGSLGLFFLICIAPLVSAISNLMGEYFIVSIGQHSLSRTVFLDGLPAYIAISLLDWLTTVVMLIVFIYLCSMERLKHAPDELYTGTRKVHLPKLNAENLLRPLRLWILIYVGIVLFQLVTQTVVSIVYDYIEGVLQENSLIDNFVFYAAQYIVFAGVIGAMFLMRKWSVRWLKGRAF